MTGYAIDSSAIIAFIKQEPYKPELETWLAYGSYTYVNLAETIGALKRFGFDPRSVDVFLEEVSIQTVPLSKDVAIMAGAMDSRLVKGGLALADRCCLAYAKVHAIPAVTADRAWSEVADTLGVEVLQIRD